MRALLPCLLALLALTGVARADDYPRISSRPIQEASYPAEVAGFSRGDFIEYDASSRNVSVSYVFQEDDLLVSATLYLYENVGSLEDQTAGASHAITWKYPGASVMDQGPITLHKNGHDFEGRRVTYTFISHFNGSTQQLYSELIVLALDSHFFKIRLTTPYHDASDADQHLRELLEHVNWQSWPSDLSAELGPDPDPDALSGKPSPAKAPRS